MKEQQSFSRRQFQRSSGTLTGAAYLRMIGPSIITITALACSAKQESATFKVLSDRDADDFAASAARIIPNNPARSALSVNGLALTARTEIERIAVVG